MDRPETFRVWNWTWSGVLLLMMVAAWCLRVTPDGQGVSIAGRRLPETCRARIAHRPCASCGLTRSVVEASRARLGAARRFHVLGTPLVLLALVQIPVRFLIGLCVPSVRPGRATAWEVAVNGLPLLLLSFLLQ